MKTDTALKILDYIQENKEATVKELAVYLQISPQALHKQLAKLLDSNKLYKVGAPPKVFYLLEKEPIIAGGPFDVDKITKYIIQENFVIISPVGELKEGWDGFIFWCKKTGQPVQKTAKEYVKIWRKYYAFKKGGLIDGIKKLKSTFAEVFLDRIFYLDFYSIERFGKTKLGQMLLYAKQSQNKKLIKGLILQVLPRIGQLIKKYKIDAVGFIPPTVKREIQFMKELERNFHFDTRRLLISKVKTEITVPQKTLNKLVDRIENARATIVVEEHRKYKNILLIDDAVGSGATLNETAAQIRNKEICKGKIIGLAITGSFKGFDVISEV